jgi:insertion element IS1 protein InsB
MSPLFVSTRPHLQRPLSCDQRTHRRHGAQWEWHSRYGTGVEDQLNDSSERAKKKESTLSSVNRRLLALVNLEEVIVVIRLVEEAEVDEMWSFVGKKREPRWLWHAIDHRSGYVLAYVLGRRKDEVSLKLKALLEPFGITQYYTDSWGAYTRHLEADEHQPGKRNTQQIERKHLTLRTRIKRLVRKTICFSKSIQMHDIVLRLFINRYEFGLRV